MKAFTVRPGVRRALARLREAVDQRFDTLEAAKVTPLERRQLMCDSVHWMTGAIHQWHATLQRCMCWPPMRPAWNGRRWWQR
jgi:hypothetical protein